MVWKVINYIEDLFIRPKIVPNNSDLIRSKRRIPSMGHLKAPCTLCSVWDLTSKSSLPRCTQGTILSEYSYQDIVLQECRTVITEKSIGPGGHRKARTLQSEVRNKVGREGHTWKPAKNAHKLLGRNRCQRPWSRRPWMLAQQKSLPCTGKTKFKKHWKTLSPWAVGKSARQQEALERFNCQGNRAEADGWKQQNLTALPPGYYFII